MLPAVILIVFAMTFLISAVATGIGILVMESRHTQFGGAGGALMAAVPPLLLQQQRLSTISLWQELLQRFDFVEKMKLRIAQAGLRWSVGRVTLMMLLLGTGSAALLFAMNWQTLALFAAIGAGFAPYGYVLHRRRKRLQKMEEQFPDVLESLSRALRAGHSFGPAMELVAGETAEPLAHETLRACEEWKLGLAWNVALENLARRVPILEVRLFVAAVTLQSRFGGTLTEILEQLATAVRDSIALRGEVRAISAQGRLTGMVLTALPIVLAGIMCFTSPLYISVLWGHPDGKYLISAALVLLALGHFAIRRIVDIKV